MSRPWNPSIREPAKVGVYERLEHDGRTVFSYWTGEHWCMGRLSVREADACHNVRSVHELPWRALAEAAQ